jgi:hypothetical protein
MNPEYARIIAARDDDRRALFAATARRIGTTEQNIDKEPLKANEIANPHQPVSQRVVRLRSLSERDGELRRGRAVARSAEAGRFKSFLRSHLP